MFTTDNADSNVRTEVSDVLGVNNYENCLLSLFPHCIIRLPFIQLISITKKLCRYYYKHHPYMKGCNNRFSFTQFT